MAALVGYGIVATDRCKTEVLADSISIFTVSLHREKWTDRQTDRWSNTDRCKTRVLVDFILFIIGIRFF